ncbi:MAG: hypothetical protein ACLFNK_01855 [Candidatus Woesearchaeota archaeon]
MSFSFIPLVDWYNVISSIDDSREGLIFKLLYHTACSESELISLKKKDFDFSNNKVSMRSRISSIPERLTKEVARYTSSMKDEEFILQGRNGPISAKRIQQIVVKRSEDILDFKITPQEIRSMHIAHALLKNISPASISSQAGVSYQRIAQIMDEISVKMEERCYSYEL